MEGQDISLFWIEFLVVDSLKDEAFWEQFSGKFSSINFGWWIMKFADLLFEVAKLFVPATTPNIRINDLILWNENSFFKELEGLEINFVAGRNVL